MKLSTQVFVTTLTAAFLAVLTALFFPTQFILVKLLAGGIVGGVGATLAVQLIDRQLSWFFDQFQSVASDVVDGESERRMNIYPDPDIGQAARKFNELIDTFEVQRRELKQERNQFESILDQLSDGVIAVDPDEKVLYLNEKAKSLLEIPDDSDSDDAPLLSEITRDDTVQEAINSCLDKRESVHEEGKRIQPDRKINLTVDASPLTDQEGNILGAVAAIHDVTKLRRLQTVRQDFVANVSHELKTPITAIQGYIETLIDDDEMDPETHNRFINKIRNQVLRMSDLVEDLLTISRLESDQESLEAKRMDVIQPLQDSLETIKPQANRKDLTLDVSLPSEPLQILGDPAAVRQISTNLLENSIKYTPEAGTISLRAFSDNDKVVLEVEDTGIGIEPRKQERIFERFYRVDEGRARSQGGTGLGLAIVKHLVLSLNGEINVESTPGQGTLFRIHLPKPE
ncbi:MAG: sensor histidine kinase [bacterium]